MGVLKKIRKSVFSFQHVIKNGLTMVTTADETASCVAVAESASVVDSDEQRENLHQISEEIVTSSTPKCPVPSQFCAHDQGVYDDDETMGPLILLHVSNVSLSSSNDTSNDEGDEVSLLSKIASSGGQRSDFAYSFERIEDDVIFEPSFETALMDSVATASPMESEVSNDASADRNTHIMNEFLSSNDESTGTSEGKMNVPLSTSSDIHPEKRFDQYGRPFVHIYTENLSTLFEMSNGGLKCADPVSETPTGRQSPIADEVQMQARWALARKQISNEGKDTEAFVTSPTGRRWFGAYLPPRSGPRSDYEI